MTARKGQTELAKLSDTNLRLEGPWQDIRGLDVYDRDDEIGSVADLYVDEVSKERVTLDLDKVKGSLLFDTNLITPESDYRRNLYAYYNYSGLAGAGGSPHERLAGRDLEHPTSAPNLTTGRRVKVCLTAGVRIPTLVASRNDESEEPSVGSGDEPAPERSERDPEHQHARCRGGYEEDRLRGLGRQRAHSYR